MTLSIYYILVGGGFALVMLLLLKFSCAQCDGPGRWRQIKRLLLLAAAEASALIGGHFLILASSKDIWYWLNLLIVPAVLALGAWWLQKSERETEQEIAQGNRRQSTLESYFDWTGKLLIEEISQNPEDEGQATSWLKTTMRARTLAVLRNLDAIGRKQVLEFLYDSDLISVSVPPNLQISTAHKGEYIPEYRDDETFLDLTSAYLAGVNLSGSMLVGIRLPEANLVQADLKETRLEKSNLVGADLTEADLEKAYMPIAGLENAKLNRANLIAAELILADLREADLRDANLTNARLTGANLWKAKLDGAMLRKVDLSAADLAEVQMIGVDLRYLTLFKTNFHEANMARSDLRNSLAVKANFVRADLTYAQMKNSILRGANISEADLTGADLTNADLSVYSGSLNWPEYEQQETSLRNANLTGAKLSGADLTGADLTGAQVTSNQLKQVESLAGATMPDGTVQPITGSLTKRKATLQPPPAYAFRHGILDNDTHALDGHPVAATGFTGSHVYLMEDGKKRWIKDIPTLEALGFQWTDVIAVGRESLRRIPDGPTIPMKAGPPPKP